MKNNSLFVLFLLSLLVGVAFQGSRGLFESTEGRYAECAREMFETGHYLEPQLNYRPHWTKPPFIYWAMAGSMHLFGQNEWAVRLPAAIAFCLLVLAVAGIGTAFAGSKTGFFAGLIFLSSFFPVFGAFTISTDMLLTLWETLAVLCYIKAWKAHDLKTQKKWVYCMWLFFGLGFITKGPVALLPLLPMIVHTFLFKTIVHIINPLSFLLFSIIGCGWYALIELKHPGLLLNLLKEEIFLRTTTDHFGRNANWYQPFVLYLPVLIFGQGLWLYYFISMIKKEKIYRFARIKETLLRRPHASLLLLWFCIPLIIFSLAQSRLILYVLPLFAPLVLALAIHIEKKNSMRTLAYISILLIILFKGFVTYYPTKKDIRIVWGSIKKYYKPGTYVYAYGEPKLFGLQFYLKGKLKRISSSDQQSLDIPMGHVLDDILNKKISFPVVIVSRRETRDNLNTLFKQKNISFSVEQVEHNKYWIIFIVREPLV